MTGRLLPSLVARFCDDVAGVLGLEASPLTQRPPVRAAKLGELTSTEFDTLWGAVDVLLDRFTPMMECSGTSRQLASFRKDLARERAERDVKGHVIRMAANRHRSHPPHPDPGLLLQRPCRGRLHGAR